MELMVGECTKTAHNNMCCVTRDGLPSLKGSGIILFVKHGVLFPSISYVDNRVLISCYLKENAMMFITIQDLIFKRCIEYNVFKQSIVTRNDLCTCKMNFIMLKRWYSKKPIRFKAFILEYKL